MNHKEMCELARRWLERPVSNNGAGCQLALSEPSLMEGGESPDALGWRVNSDMSGSYMVEVKVGRGDFLSDHKKPFRRRPSTGVGQWRFYMCPEGLIQPGEIPNGWGLIWVNPRGHVKPQIFLHQDMRADRFNYDHSIPGNSKLHYRAWLRRVERTKMPYNMDHERKLLIASLRKLGDANKLTMMIRGKDHMIRSRDKQIDNLHSSLDRLCRTLREREARIDELEALLREVDSNEQD